MLTRDAIKMKEHVSKNTPEHVKNPAAGETTQASHTINVVLQSRLRMLSEDAGHTRETTHGKDSVQAQLGRPRHLHLPEHNDGHRQQAEVRHHMHRAKAAAKSVLTETFRQNIHLADDDLAEAGGWRRAAEGVNE